MNTFIKDKFHRFILFSVLGHIALILVFKIQFSFWTPSEDILIKKAIRVDIVALPEKQFTPPAPKAVTKPSPQKPVIIKKTKPKSKKKTKVNKKAQKDALKKLKMMSALDKIKQQVAQDEAIKKAMKKKPKPIPQKQFVGNVITSGDNFEGLDKLSMNEYYSRLETHIQSYWFLPQWLDELDLKAQALVQIDKDGNVISRSIYSSSNNNVFDETVLQTIDKSSPLPAPPERLRGVLKNNGFVLKFPN